MQSIGLKIVLLVLLAGNIFGFVMLQRDKKNMQRKYPRLTNSVIRTVHVIQIANVISIVGTWLFHSWAVWLGLSLAIIVLVLDVYIKLWYHTALVVVATAIVGSLIYINWSNFS
jgi:uncharacterized protein YneF (UPF0154 family)